ncbi:hypothetical protein CQA49_03330 [Helicobacter sp. MIT 00-7814]|uniref:prohibitin family protein n=1 Tax=unclassified Helicobacter TaxID=2593540 RepID=UPI000E1F18EB|nr:MULTISPECIES: prohibitin family protein [unclassified Helicobacter]RDU55507.1 hypothetical protein CQA37_03750 [Helicobacter sp. MIT 99-10781]RDU55597.1 hypothetical protein CQA49_03330 [Helicobacter sp. MIT 00-7814]
MPIDLNEHLKNKRQQSQNQQKENPEPKKDDGKNNNNWGGGNNWNNNRGGSDFSNLTNFVPSGKKLFIWIVIIALLVILIAQKPFVIVNSGEVGIKVHLGEYQKQPLEAGLHFFIPPIEHVIIVDTRVKTLHFTSNEDMERRNNQSIAQKVPIQVRDKLGLDVAIELTLKYQLDRAKVSDTIRDYTTLWDEVIIVPGILEVVGSVIGNYHAEELPSKRDEIANLIATNFQNKINAIRDKPVRLDSVELRKIILPPEVKNKIEQVQVAKQEAEKAKEEARALRERSQGKADAAIIEATGQAKANQLVSESLSSRLLELRQIEMQGKFNDALRENKDAQIFLTPGGSVPNIWVDSKNKRQNTAISQ